MSAATKAAAPERAPYDQDAEDFLRWGMKEEARRLCSGARYKPKRKKETYDTFKTVKGPTPDITDALRVKIPVTRFRWVNIEESTVMGDFTSIRRAPMHRVQNCCRDKIKKDIAPEVWYSKKSERAGFQKVQVCGSVWTCPTCTRKINLERQRQIAAAYELVIGKADLVHHDDMFDQVRNADAIMVTMTIKHGHGDKLADLLPLLKAADRHMQQGKRYRRLVSRGASGHIGRLTTTEMTHGANGWHPHLHQLWFFDRRLSAVQVDALRRDLYESWVAACIAVGLPAPMEFSPAYTRADGVHVPAKPLGVHVVRALTADEYLSKHGTFERHWTIEREMASGHRKGARKGGRSPFQLLFDSMNGDKDAGRLFRDYADATKGHHQLEFSSSLRKYLESLGYTAHQLSNEEIAALNGEDSDLLGELDDTDFDTLCNARRHGEKNAFGSMLHICKHEGFPAALAWLAKLRRQSAENCAEGEVVDLDTGEVLSQPNGMRKSYENSIGNSEPNSSEDGKGECPKQSYRVLEDERPGRSRVRGSLRKPSVHKLAGGAASIANLVATQQGGAGVARKKLVVIEDDDDDTPWMGHVDD